MNYNPGPDKNGTYICPHCDGSGELTYICPEGAFDVPCVECQGAGRVAPHSYRAAVNLEADLYGGVR